VVGTISDDERRALNRLPVDAPPGEDEREHFIQCPICRQWIDCRELGDVMHHAEPGHAPIRPDA
jgi:hypothetical protein